MTKITGQILKEAIGPLDEVFDTHAVIRKVTQQSPREYAVALAATNGDDPFIVLHGSIGKHLLTFGEIEPTKKVYSLNIRGQETENQEWRKI